MTHATDEDKAQFEFDMLTLILMTLGEPYEVAVEDARKELKEMLEFDKKIQGR